MAGPVIGVRDRNGCAMGTAQARGAGCTLHGAVVAPRRCDVCVEAGARAVAGGEWGVLSVVT